MNRAEEVLRRIENDYSRYLPIVSGRRSRILVEAVRAAKPTAVLEVGTLVGYSTILIGRELGEEAHIVTIEADPDEAMEAEANIREAKIPPRVDVRVGDAVEIIGELAGEFDFVFLDAEKSEYLTYLRLAESKLRRGAVIAADNAGLCGGQMGDYLDYVRTSGRYRSKYVPAGADGMEISVKS